MGNVVTIEGFTFELEWLHFGVMGKAGTGKSHLLASMPKPLLVLATDPMTKLHPYYDHGIVDPKVYTGNLGQDIRLVKNKDGKTIIQIEGFYDRDPSLKNAAMTALVSRTTQLHGEANAGMWKSTALDSWSGFEDLARYRRLVEGQPFHVKNPDGRAHHNIAKEDCKSPFLHTLIHLNCNMGISFHVTRFAQESGGEVMYNVKCIGDFAQTISQNLAERYHSISLPDGVTRRLHTRPDGRFELATLIDAPDPCENTFGALFANKIGKLLAEAKKAKAAEAPQTA
jgi:hypothetical protein